MLSGNRWFNLAPVRNSMQKNLKFMATSPYYNPTTYTSCESQRTCNSLAASHPTTLRRHQITSQISIGLTLELVLTNVMARAMSMFLPGQ